MDWDTWQNAVFTWIAACTELPDQQVGWRGENQNRQVRPFVTLSVDAISTEGYPSTQVIDNPTPVAGEEILIVSCELSPITMTLRGFGEIPPADSEMAAQQLIRKFVVRARAGVGKSGIRAVGLSVNRFDPVISVGGPIGKTQLEPRALVTFRGYMTETVEIPETYIETLKTQGTFTT